MILRTYFTLLCLVTGCLMADAFYLKFKPPRNKASAIKAIQSEAGKQRYPRHIDHITQWLRNKGRKQLVVLDRKDKRVQEFINQLIVLIEQSQLPGQTKTKKHCHKTFGSIKDARNKKVICERYIEQAQVKKPQINLLIPISRYLDTMAGYPEDREKESDFENEDTTKDMISRKGNFQLRRGSSSDSSSDSDDDEGRGGKMPTRFEIVKNQRDKRMHDVGNAKQLRKKKLKRPIESETDSDDSASDTGKVWGHVEKSSEDSDLDDNKGEEISDSQEYKAVGSAKKEKHKESVADNYVYLQGSRMFDLGRRFHRNPNHFMSKRYRWDSEELNHLGYYWFEGPQGRNPRAK